MSWLRPFYLNSAYVLLHNTDATVAAAAAAAAVACQCGYADQAALQLIPAKLPPQELSEAAVRRSTACAFGGAFDGRLHYCRPS